VAPSLAIDHAIALLIVTCPCALALATPLAVSVAIGRAATQGILVKGGDVLEVLARPGLLVLDKTGTVTEGRTSLVSWEGPDWVRPLVLAVERHATHPVASGFAAAWPDLAVPEATDVRHVPGGGISGDVCGRQVRVGSWSFVGGSADGDAPAGDADALTPIHIAVDGRPVALARFGDPIRADARTTLDRLRARGWRPRLLSGDHPGVVAAVGRALAIAPADCVGGASPEDKLLAIEEAESREPVVMVGDGINDAAAIARATAGVGVRGGAEACVSAADVFLARPGLDGLLALVEGSRRTLAVIRRNIVFAIAYNVAGVAMAMTGHITPLIAAILMPASSLTVVLASWRSRTFQRGAP
jgi:Cu2+-exporting ATPase